MAASAVQTDRKIGVQGICVPCAIVPPMTKQPLIIEAMQHNCIGCGACCQGAKVYVRPGEEADRVRRLAKELGVVEEAVGDDNWLLRDGGRCAFLQDDGLCSIHARFGMDAKPNVCKQFPYVIIETESGIRVGMDPCSTNSIHAYKTGGDVQPPPIVEARPCHFPEPMARAEQALVQLTMRDGATLSSVAGALCGVRGHTGPELPPGFAGRIVEVLQGSGLPIVMQAKDCGPFQRAALAPVLAAYKTWDPQNPPAWPPAVTDIDDYGLWVMRNMLQMRLATTIPMPQGVALICLVGIIANAWTHTDRSLFGKGTAAWARVMRAGAFWQAITPDPGTMQFLGTGQK